MRPRGVVLLLALLPATGCRTARGPLGPDAASIIEGTAAGSVRVDTTTDPFAVSLGRGHWRTRTDRSDARDFWTDVSVLDVSSAEADAANLDERTFAVALRQLMSSDPDGASVAFSALRTNARDSLVRMRSRVGLTMALTWASDWSAIAGMGTDTDSLGWVSADPLTRHTTVERWAHAFAGITPASISVPDQPTVVPLRRSMTGVPVVRVRINGHPHEFWLDTGASMTIISADIARDGGVYLAARDTLALGVVGGNIDARAVVIDSISVGKFVARGVTAALVSPRMLRLDYRLEGGQQIPVHIDGVLGSDLLRRVDLVIDADAGTVSIRKPRRDPHATRNLFWIGFPVVRLVARDGRPLLFGLDTGADSTYVTMNLLRKLPRTPVAARRGAMHGLGEHAERTDWVAQDLAVSDGEYAIGLDNVPVAPDHHWTFVTFDGMIGSDIALGTRLHLDFENGIFDIRPTAAAKPKPFVRTENSPFQPEP